MAKHIFPYGLCILLFCWLSCMATTVKAQEEVLNRVVYLPKSKGTVYVLLGMVSERTDFLFIYDSKVVDNERNHLCSIYIIMYILCFPIVYVLVFMFYNRFINQVVS